MNIMFVFFFKNVCHSKWNISNMIFNYVEYRAMFTFTVGVSKIAIDVSNPAPQTCLKIIACSDLSV